MVSVSLPAAPEPVGDQVIVLRDVPWQQYSDMCDARADTAGPRMAFLDGLLEIMSPSRTHEHNKTLIARLIECYADELEIPLNGFGSETFKKKAKKAGVEPDECYSIGGSPPLPDFAVEVVHTSGGIDKLALYQRLGIREVWFWINDNFHVYRLVRDRFVRSTRSHALPHLDLKAMADVVRNAPEDGQMQAVRAWRMKLRKAQRP